LCGGRIHRFTHVKDKRFMLDANTQSVAYRRRWLGLIFIGLSLLVISLDNTVLNVAIPSISRTLGATASELQWIIDAYVLVFAALLLTMGAVGDRWGRKRALQAGLVLFGLGSVGAAVASTTEMLIALRAFLGIGGALIMPATLSIISATFPPKERPQAIAIWAAVFALGVGIGPVVGGWLTQNFDWHAVFLINIPVVIVALIGGQLLLGESKDASAPKPDIPGVLLSITGLFALIYGIIEAGVVGWTEPNVLIAFVAAAILLGIFAWWESQAPNAMLPMSFFRNRSFTGANTALALLTFSLFGSTFFMSQYFQTVQRAGAFEGGLRVLPMAITLTFVATQSARVAARLGTKRTVALGIFFAGVGLFYLSRLLQVDTPYPLVMIGQIILGTGMGLAVSPATHSIMASVPVDKAGVGSAMNDTTRQLGGALGIAVLGTLMYNVYIAGVDTLQTQLPSLPAETHAAIASSIQAAHIEAAKLPAEVASVVITTADQAFVRGMNNAMLVGSIIMLGATVLVLLVLPNQLRRTGEVPVQVRATGEAAAVSGD
jgi:EmrB/QacA subfamily drug resistance transporter